MTSKSIKAREELALPSQVGRRAVVSSFSHLSSMSNAKAEELPRPAFYARIDLQPEEQYK